jgi:hypothetical protein
MARPDKYFFPDFAFQRLRELFRKEISVASDSPSDIKAKARALRGSPTETPRIDLLASVLFKYGCCQFEQHRVAFREIALARNTLKLTYLRQDLEFSTVLAGSYELLLAKLSPDKPRDFSLREKVVRNLAVERSRQEKCKGRIQDCEKRDSTLRGSSTKPRRGEPTPLEMLKAKLRDDTISLLDKAGYEPAEIAATIYKPSEEETLEEAAERVAKYISRLKCAEKRLNKSRTVQ